MTDFSTQQARDLLKLAGEKYLTLGDGVKIKFVGTDKNFNTSRRRVNPCRLYVCNLSDVFNSDELQALDNFLKEELSKIFELIGLFRDVNIKSLGELKLVFYVGFDSRYRKIETRVITLFKDGDGKFMTPFTADCENGSNVYIESLHEIDTPYYNWDYSVEVDEIDLRDSITYSNYVRGNERVFYDFPFLKERTSALLKKASQRNLLSLKGYIDAARHNPTEQNPLRYIEPNKCLSYLLSDNNNETLSYLSRFRLCEYETTLTTATTSATTQIVNTDYNSDF